MLMQQMANATMGGALAASARAIGAGRREDATALVIQRADHRHRRRGTCFSLLFLLAGPRSTAFSAGG